ncbi:SURF1 family protein [Pseudidiomarina insulisalsae]|uniref:SURF1-like protein n=1 Tax=Pseudidiomarina insulisalsae TaxID=575789 RepID=A0A432YPL4_9GAMM|nr:SURF1 family protein [Pseudidiomarina insulisalsae]RUO63015.1 hypothetical protein CWI71_01955 [Pseudidiomarina insulisalsae]
MRIGTILITLLTVLAFGFLVKLGFWQLDRAAEKQRLFDDFASARQQADSANFTPLPVNTDGLERYQPVQVSGQFLNAYLLLDNQIFQREVGYQVIGLLQVTDRKQLIPVNMGWVPVGPDRRQLPQLEVPAGTVTVTGWWYPANQHAFSLADHIVEPGGPPWRVQQLRFKEISESVALPIATSVVLLSENANYGWPRHWEPQVMSPEKHQAYALQWFSLAVVGLIIVLLVRRSITKTKKESA